MIAYHFVGPTLRDGRPIPADDEWLVHDGPVELYRSGLYASEHPFDALRYAPGETLCLVECEDIVVRYDTKFGCRRRRILKRIDATDLLRLAARQFASAVLPRWSAPLVVRQFLATGDEDLRAYARATAKSHARDTIGAAAWSASWAATRVTRHAPLYDPAPSAWLAAETARRAGSALDSQRDLFARMVKQAIH